MTHLNRVIALASLILISAGVYAREATYDCQFASPHAQGTVSFILSTDSIADGTTKVLTIRFTHADGLTNDFVYDASRTRSNHRDILGSPLYTFMTTGHDNIAHSMTILGDKTDINLVYKGKTAKGSPEMGASIPYTPSTWETIESILSDFAAGTVR